VGDTAEYETLFNLSNFEPLIHRILDPAGHGNRAYMTTLAEKIDDAQ